ncbi:CheY chemotaxis protein or a CheY-like REC (receiver) domain [Natronorubrum sediminis]|uniref:CheY chemotaxis protein or a CheY-like REC (Receiver) domain n=1 Tax=Natronorubrum sediminis TaxID=640943 RepID=A0A1H6FPR6_9EURY|nr:CheY chemotaxis protein or a CheY-like REC (receiver) domain [Natronorubrum sediminis]
MDTSTHPNSSSEVNDILLVEDNPADIRFVEETVDGSSLDVTVHSVSTSAASVDFIYQRGEYSDTPEPDLVFLDWNLRRTTGREVLTAIKTDYSHIPVVILTGSKAKVEADHCPSTKADLVKEKPTDPDGYVEIICSIAPSQ